MFLSLQYLRHSEIYSVVVGVRTTEPRPIYFFVKSVTNGYNSSESTMQFSLPTMLPKVLMSSLVMIEKAFLSFLRSTVFGASKGELAEVSFNLEAICSADSNNSSVVSPDL